MTSKHELMVKVKDLEWELLQARRDADLAASLREISDRACRESHAKIQELADIVKSFKDEGMINGRALFEVFADAAEDWVDNGWRYA